MNGWLSAPGGNASVGECLTIEIVCVSDRGANRAVSHPRDFKAPSSRPEQRMLDDSPRVRRVVTGRLLTARQVAELLDVSPETVLRWTRRGELPAVRLPGTKRGRLRFRPDDLEAWIDARATGAADREVSATRTTAPTTAAYVSPLSFPVSATRPRERAATTEEEPTDATR